MIELISSIACNIIESLLIILLCYAMIRPSHQKRNTIKTIFIIIILVCTVVVDITENNNIIFTLTSFIIKFLLVYLIIEPSLPDLIMTYGLSYILIFVAELPVALLTQPLNKALPQDIYNILGSLITLIIIVIIYKFLPLNKYYKTIREEYPSTLLIIVNVVFIIIFISIYFRSKPENFYVSTIAVLTAYILILAINVELSITRVKLTNQKNEIDTQNEKIKTYEAYLPAISDLITDVRERQHNYNDKLQTIYALSVTHTDYTSLHNALQKECATISLPSDSAMLLRLDLKILAAFLFSKCRQARQENKVLSISMPSDTYSSSVPEYILVEMMGVLVNNALEATPEGGTVYLTLDCGGGTFGAEIKNVGTPFTEKEKNDIFLPGYTTKTEKRRSVLNVPELNLPRGYGLSSLKKLAEEYDCDIIIDSENKGEESFIVFRLITTD